VRREKGEGEGRREKGEGRREKGEGRREKEKGEGRRRRASRLGREIIVLSFSFLPSPFSLNGVQSAPLTRTQAR
jgi:hypothetical protein